MRSTRVAVLVGLLCLALVGGVVAAGHGVAVYVHGQPVAAQAIIQNGVTYLPVRAVAEALGVSVQWDPAARAVYVGERPTSASVTRPADAPAAAAPRNLGEKLAESSDIEVHGSWKNGPNGHSYTAEGEATNTGQSLAPFVRITATFKGAELISLDADHTSFIAEDFVLAEGSTEMRNLRPGETRRFFISAVNGYTGAPGGWPPPPEYRGATDARGQQFAGAVWDGKAIDCVMSAAVEKGPAEPEERGT